MDSAIDWDTFKEETLEAARRTVGIRPRSNKSSVLVETLAAINESCTARLAGDRRWHSELEKRSNAQLRTDQERVVSELAREAEDGFN